MLPPAMMLHSKNSIDRSLPLAWTGKHDSMNRAPKKICDATVIGDIA